MVGAVGCNIFLFFMERISYGHGILTSLVKIMPLFKKLNYLGVFFCLTQKLTSPNISYLCVQVKVNINNVLRLIAQLWENKVATSYDFKIIS